VANVGKHGPTRIIRKQARNGQLTEGVIMVRPRRLDAVRLAIDLQDGFRGDLVAVHVNGQQIYYREGVTTSSLLGLADSIKTDLESGLATVDIAVSTQGMAETIELQLVTDLYLGVSIVHRELEYIISREPFGYS
jgi:hypothetical protein